METDSLANGLSLLLGGFLMLLPGYATDAVGILCFVPGLRFMIGTALLSRLHIASIQNMFGSRFAGGFTNTANEEFDNRSHTSHRRRTLDNDIIEGEFKEKD